MVSVPYIRYLFLNDRFERIARALAAGTAPANPDIKPVCCQYAIINCILRLIRVHDPHEYFGRCVLPRTVNLLEEVLGALQAVRKNRLAGL
jgi:hypothetical protein